jgi:hypothetical protein
MKQLRTFLAEAVAITSIQYAAISSGFGGSIILAEDITDHSLLEMWQMIAIALR